MDDKDLSKKEKKEDGPRYCPACQAVWLGAATKFCGYCGTKLGKNLKPIINQGN